MGATVGAALKKVAVLIMTDKDTLKAFGMVVLTIAVAVVLPTMAVVGIFSGTIELDADALRQEIVANLSAEELALLTGIEGTMGDLEAAMSEAGFAERTPEAQALYIMALFEFSGQPGFVSRLVSCFAAEQTDAQLIANVNREFATEILVEDFSNVMQNIRSQQIDGSGYTDPSTKNNLDLVEWAIQAEEAGWGYVWGTFGQVLTRELLEAKLEQYPEELGEYEDFIRANWVGKRTADCIGLIKGYSWYNPETGEIVYASNGMPDVGANQMYSLASEKGTIDTIPEIPGLLVWMDGHIGIYIGDGEVVEAMGTLYGVVQTQLSGRGWTHWLKNPYITYVEVMENEENEYTCEFIGSASNTLLVRPPKAYCPY